MTEAQQKYINSVDHDKFVDTCVRMWAEDGFPLFGDVASLVVEEYNNAAIDALLKEAGLDEDDDE